MKWLILLAILFSLLVVFLLNSTPVDTDPLHTPSPGGVALPFVLIVVLFVVGLGAFPSSLAFRNISMTPPLAKAFSTSSSVVMACSW